MLIGISFMLDLQKLYSFMFSLPKSSNILWHNKVALEGIRCNIVALENDQLLCATLRTNSYVYTYLHKYIMEINIKKNRFSNNIRHD